MVSTAKDTEERLEFDIRMPSFLKKISVETIVLVVFFLLLLKFIAAYEGGRLIHGSPYQLVAGDMYTFVSFAEVSKDVNNYTMLPPYMANGYTDVANLFSPTAGIITTQLALMSGAETYDIVLHIGIAMLILMIIGSYLALKKFNKTVAITGLVLGLLAWKWPFSYIINWGAQLSVLNFLFTIGSLIAFFYLKEKYMFIVLGILNAAGFLAHGREFLTFNISIAAFFFLQWALNRCNFKKVDWKLFKNYVYSIGITIVLLFRYLPIWKQFSDPHLTQQTGNRFFRYCPLSPDSYHYVSFEHLGIFKWLVFVGIVIALYYIYKKMNENTAISMTLLYSLMYLFSSYFCIYGNKTTQIRHFYPIFLIPLLGIGIYAIIKFAKNKIDEETLYKIGIGIAAVLAVVALAQHQPVQVPEYGISNPYTWEGIQWVQKNVPQDKNVLVFYGDNFGQETLFYSLKRTWHIIIRDAYLQNIQQGIITPNVLMKFNIVGWHYKRESLFELDVIRYAGPNNEDLKQYVDSLCNYDYIFSNKRSQNEIVSKYTQTALMALIQESNFSIAFQNDLMVVLKNNNVKGPCFAERKFT